MQLQIPLRIPADDRLVGDIGEEALQAVEEGIIVATFHRLYKATDLKRSLRSLYIRIER